MKRRHLFDIKKVAFPRKSNLNGSMGFKWISFICYTHGQASCFFIWGSVGWVRSAKAYMDLAMQIDTPDIKKREGKRKR